MAMVAPGQLVVIHLRKTIAADDEVVLSFGTPQEVKHDVARVKLDAAISKHDRFNKQASPKRYGAARCLHCKKRIIRRSYNECQKCKKYVCPGCNPMHDFTNHTVRAAL